MSMGILEFRDSVTFPAFSGEFSQQHLPFRVAPALVFVEIVGQLPRKRAAVEVEISRFVHAVQLSGQIVLVVVALAAVRQRSGGSLRTGWYSGRTLVPDRQQLVAALSYLKLGPYVAKLGPLNSPETNQRFYRVEPDGTLTDLTHRFWRKG